MHIHPANPTSHARRATLVVCVALLAGSCGGGGGGAGGGGTGGGGGGIPPPVAEPPVFTTPTAVRVTQATPFAAGCLPLPAGAVAYTDAEVEPHLAIDPANANHLVAAWQQDRLSDGGARGLATSVSVDGGATWSRPQPAPFTQCAGGAFARASDPWVAITPTSVMQIGIAFTGDCECGRRAQRRAGEPLGRWRQYVGRGACRSSTTMARASSTTRKA